MSGTNLLVQGGGKVSSANKAAGKKSVTRGGTPPGGDPPKRQNDPKGPPPEMVRLHPGQGFVKVAEVRAEFSKFPGLNEAFPEDAQLSQVSRPMLDEISARAGGEHPEAAAGLILEMGAQQFDDWLQSGLTLQHFQDFKAAAMEHGFIFVRPVNPLATRLIEEGGVATKAMDVKGKSADWGPQAGFIPFDQALSKKAVGGATGKELAKRQKAIEQANAKNEAALKLTEEGRGKVTKMELSISQTRVNELQARGQLPMDLEPGQPFAALDEKGGDTHFMLVENEHGHFDVLVEKTPGEGFKPLEVMGYQQDGEPPRPEVPVTADYDLFSVCPHQDHLEKAGLTGEYKEADGLRDFNHEGLGKLTDWDQATGITLNLVTQGKDGLQVVHHGPETSNPHPEQGEPVVMFTPSGRARMVPREQLADIWHDMFVGGHVVSHNHHWTGPDAAIKAPKTVHEPGALELRVLDQGDFDADRPFLESVGAAKKHQSTFHSKQLSEGQGDE